MSETKELPGPFEILELADGESVTFRVLSWTRGITTIRPRYPGAPSEKVIDVLRVVVPTEYKATFPAYYDITSKRLIAQLIGYLEAPGFEGLVFKVTAQGRRPRKWFQLEVTPAK